MHQLGQHRRLLRETVTEYEKMRLDLSYIENNHPPEITNDVRNARIDLLCQATNGYIFSIAQQAITFSHDEKVTELGHRVYDAYSFDLKWGIDIESFSEYLWISIHDLLEAIKELCRDLEEE